MMQTLKRFSYKRFPSASLPAVRSCGGVQKSARSLWSTLKIDHFRRFCSKKVLTNRLWKRLSRFRRYAQLMSLCLSLMCQLPSALVSLNKSQQAVSVAVCVHVLVGLCHCV